MVSSRPISLTKSRRSRARFFSVVSYNKTQFPISSPPLVSSARCALVFLAGLLVAEDHGPFHHQRAAAASAPLLLEFVPGTARTPPSHVILAANWILLIHFVLPS